MARVAGMKLVGEITIIKIAKALSVFENTVKRDWIKARGWLDKNLKGYLND